MAWEILTPCLVACLIDIRYLLTDTFRLITDISVQIAIIFCFISWSAAGSRLILLNVHDRELLFLLCSRVFRKCDFLLGNDIDLALIGWVLRGCGCLTPTILSLLLLL